MVTSTKSPVGTAGHDAELLQAVKQALAAVTGNPHFRQVQINVHEGFVVLKGSVGSYYQKQIAQEIVKQVDGVEAMLNELVVV